MNNSLHKDINIDKFKAVNDNLSSYDFYRQSAIIPILHYNMIISEEAAFLIKAGLTGLMIISAAKDASITTKYHMISLDTFRKYRYSDIIKGISRLRNVIMMRTYTKSR